jgi:hypothetical protein
LDAGQGLFCNLGLWVGSHKFWKLGLILVVPSTDTFELQPTNYVMWESRFLPPQMGAGAFCYSRLSKTEFLTVKSYSKAEQNFGDTLKNNHLQNWLVNFQVHLHQERDFGGVLVPNRSLHLESVPIFEVLLIISKLKS